MKHTYLQLPVKTQGRLPIINSRRLHIGPGRHNIAYRTDGNDDDDEDVITEKLDKLKTGLENFLSAKQKKHFDEVSAKVIQMSEKIETMEDAAKKNQAALDNLLVKASRGDIGVAKKKSFGEAFADEIATQFSEKADQIKAFSNDKNAKLKFDLKVVGNMTVGANLTGDGQASYNPRQGLVPNQKINFRDLIPSVTSPTGLYVSYRETGGEGAIADQTEGNPKAQLDYDFTEVKNVSGYVAGFVRFSKQMMHQLPWLQNTLVRMLLRDFYKRENAKFYAAVAGAATGYNTTAETDDAKAFIDVLMGRADQDFNNSFILVKNSQKGRILKLLYENGYYLGSGSVLGMPDGTIRVADTPVIGVSWATSDKAMIVDSDFIERVETESLRVEFSYEDSDNFQRNLVTARVECFEDLNLLRTDAHSYLDMGNES